MIHFNLSFFVWCLILLSIILLAVVRNVRHKHHHQQTGRGRILSLGSEHEEFYVPGDNLVDDEDD